MWLAHRYTVDGAIFPDPREEHEWLNTPVYIGQDPRDAVAYSAHYWAMKGYCADAEIFLKQITHFWRKWMARWLDERGLPLEV